MSEALKKRILVVDDEPELSELVSGLLSDEGYEVVTCMNGQEASAALKEHSFDLVVSDVRMPQMSGVDLLKWVLEHTPSTKAILMTGFADVKDTVKASELGHRAFLQKPFSKELLLAVVADALTNVSWAKFDEKKFAAITIDDFISVGKVDFPLFVKLQDDRFVRICHAGDNILKERLLLLKTKKIYEVWLDNESFHLYMTSQQQITESLRSSDKIPPQKKAAIAKHSCEVAVESLRVLGVSGEGLETASKLLEETVHFLIEGAASEPNGLVVNFLEASRHSVDNHSVMCGALAGVFAYVMGWASKKNIQLFVSGAFFHDIGLFELPEKLRNKPYETMTKEEKEIYEKHPINSYNMLRKVKGIPKEIGLIVLEHHESPKGNGYPRGLSKTEIFPMGRAVNLIDSFLDLWDRASAQERTNGGVVFLDSLVNKDPMSYDVNDVLALKLVLTEPNLKKAQQKFEKGRK